MSKTRRHFIKKLSGGLIGAAIVPELLARDAHTYRQIETLSKKVSANDTIRVAAIGMGIMGFNNCQTATSIPGVELVAVCDLYDGHFARSKSEFGGHLFTTRDYREILRRDDIDAVIISTPDHWHDHISIAALESGKAVYCEKPMVHHLNEGHAVIEAQRKSGKVLQVGSQRVSSIVTAKAKALYKEGIIGELVMVEAYNDRQSPLGAWQYSIPTDASPQTIDWEAFLGDAPKVPYDPVRFFRWRNYQDYGTGVAGDLYVHLFSGIHTILDSKGPDRIYSSGGLRYWKDGRDVPDIILGIFDYPETKAHPAFNLQLRSNFVDGGGGGSKTRFVGTDGTMEVRGNSVIISRNPMPTRPGYGGWDTYNTFTESQQKEYVKWYESEYPDPGPQMQEPENLEFQAPREYSDHLDHHLNFFNAVREGGTVTEDATFGLRAAGPSLACNMSYFEKKPIHWDPEKMEVRT